MSTIRPLATITLLFAVGVFLWYRINDAPLVPIEDNAALVDELPPLAGSEGPAALEPITTDASEGPALFGGGDTNKPEQTPVAATTKAPAAEVQASLPELPALPDLPKTETTPTTPIPAAPAPKTTVQNSTPKPATKPAVVPAMPSITGNVPSLGTEVGGVAQSTPDAGASSVQLDPNPPSEELTLGPPSVATGEFKGPSAFAQAKPAIDAALSNGDLTTALAELTKWYGDDTLSTAEREQVDGLLGQLAGTVVYSGEHRLGPPHTVAAGETLETIAQQYQVPWQLLAKINGVTSPTAVQPGQQLKVIRGPFSAALDLNRQELALMVGANYAGRFGVTAQGAAATEGEWIVADKKMEPSSAGDLSKQVVLTDPATPGASLVLTSDPNAGGYGSPYQGAIRISPGDENDLFDILSVGSRVVIRR